jgi:hypothetical protein
MTTTTTPSVTGPNDHKAIGPDDLKQDADPDGPPKMIFHVEREDIEGVGTSFKPYRRFFGRPPKGLDLERVIIEHDSQDESAKNDLWLVPKGQDCPGGEGTSDRLKDGRILTVKPERFGTPAEREADGRKPLMRIPWEEHSFVPADFDEPEPAAAPEEGPVGA